MDCINCLLELKIQDVESILTVSGLQILKSGDNFEISKAEERKKGRIYLFSEIMVLTDNDKNYWAHFSCSQLKLTTKPDQNLFYLLSQEDKSSVVFTISCSAGGNQYQEWTELIKFCIQKTKLKQTKKYIKKQQMIIENRFQTNMWKVENHWDYGLIYINLFDRSGGIEVKNQSKKLKTIKNCFLGSTLIDW